MLCSIVPVINFLFTVAEIVAVVSATMTAEILTVGVYGVISAVVDADVVEVLMESADVAVWTAVE